MAPLATFFRRSFPLALTLTFALSSAAQALPPQVYFDAVVPRADGTVELQFRIASFGGELEKVNLVDNDGFATLAALTYVLIQQPSEQLYLNQKKWEELGPQPVEGWAIVRERIAASVERMYEAYSSSRAMNLQTEAVTHVLATRSRLTQFQERAPTYEQFNHLIGSLVERTRKFHSYAGFGPLINGSSELGQALSGRGFTLPTEFMSRSRAIFKLDLAKLIQPSAAAPSATAPAAPKLGNATAHFKADYAFNHSFRDPRGEYVLIDTQGERWANRENATLYLGPAGQLRKVGVKQIDTYRDGGTMVFRLEDGSTIMIPAPTKTGVIPTLSIGGREFSLNKVLSAEALGLVAPAPALVTPSTPALTSFQPAPTFGMPARQKPVLKFDGIVALFSTARIPYGPSVIANLNDWQTISDEAVLQTKRVILAALQATTLPMFDGLTASGIGVAHSRGTDSIRVEVKQNHPLGTFSLLKDGSIALAYARSAAIAQSFAEIAQAGLTPQRQRELLKRIAEVYPHGYDLSQASVNTTELQSSVPYLEFVLGGQQHLIVYPDGRVAAGADVARTTPGILLREGAADMACGDVVLGLR